MASPHRDRAGTASPASRTPQADHTYIRKSHNSPYRHSPRRSETLIDEIGALHIREERAWRERQDERDAEQERLHQQALAQAKAEHDRILRNAIEAAEAEALKQERERMQKEEEERRTLEAERSAKAAREAAERQRRREELERQEQEQQKRAAEEREIQEKEARLAQQKRQNEADALRRKQEQEASERKAKEEADAAAAAIAATKAAPPAQTAPQSQPPPAPVPAAQPGAVSAFAAQPAPKPATQPAASSSASTAQSSLKSTPEQLKAQHERYLAIHKSLKEMRNSASKQLKASGIDISVYRRQINTVMGQFTPDKVKNRTTLKRVLEILNDVLKHPEPAIDITPFLAIPPDNSERRMPLALVYLLHMIAKLVIRQFCNDNIATVDALAIVLVTVFSKAEYLFNGTTSLIDILLAKYHKVCPVLFGIYGNEKTEGGRETIGWLKNSDGWVDSEVHKNRMLGLATGYGCISLRDFSKSKSNNPFPPPNYWKALSHFANTPPANLQPTHWIVLKALVDTHIEKFLKFYGQAGIAALRRVLVELPKNAPQNPARDAVAIFPEMLRTTKGLTL
ncbi:GLE1-domain-containing protein [Aureobasidium sp. EXF-10727]|nr:GLE1-domain-containing protein [Aureobasidium sp. EXF-10727]